MSIRSIRAYWTLLLGSLGVACGAAPSAPPPNLPPSANEGSGAPEDQAPKADAPKPDAPKPGAREPKELLSTCTQSDSGLCLPDPSFVARLCDGQFPDAALVMFGGKSLFSRVYLKGATEGWNADAGKSARAKLFFQE